MKNKLLIIPLLGAALAGGAIAGAASLANAATSSASTGSGAPAMMQFHGPHGAGIAGTVASISGTTLTVTGKDGTSYTVDAANAKVMKMVNGAPTTETVSNIAANDTVMVRGTVNGNSVTATTIMNGNFPANPPQGKMMRGFGHGTMGTVSAINGTTITVTGKDGGTYTVDASSATVRKSGNSSTVANIQVGDTVFVNGTITTASMTAKSIDDGMPTPKQKTTSQ